jgi:hypothetical protein
MNEVVVAYEAFEGKKDAIGYTVTLTVYGPGIKTQKYDLRVGDTLRFPFPPTEPTEK